MKYILTTIHMAILIGVALLLRHFFGVDPLLFLVGAALSQACLATYANR